MTAFFLFVGFAYVVSCVIAVRAYRKAPVIEQAFASADESAAGDRVRRRELCTGRSRRAFRSSRIGAHTHNLRATQPAL